MRQITSGLLFVLAYALVQTASAQIEGEHE